MIKMANRKSGQAFIVILMISLFLGLIAIGVWQLQSSQINMLSKSARDYVALSVAESGLHCVLAEMKADYQFVTHGNPYIPSKGNDWPSPTSRKYNYVGSSNLLKTNGNSNGAYKGSVEFPELKIKGEFKVRVKLINSKNSISSKSVDEAHRYFLLESYGKAGDSYRKISTVIERFLPGNFLLYDGQVLDIGGYGPYRVNRGMMIGGRIYGHEMIITSKRGGIDSTADLYNTEKISTPGYIKAETSVNVEFLGKRKGTISPKNDSTNPDTFETFAVKNEGKISDQFMLDANHGAKPQLLPPLNPSYYRDAKKPHPEVLRAGSMFKGFSESKWRNPEKPSEKVYDLFFGWDYKKDKDDFLIYSEVPLRVWGCPKWTALTIFCEKDVYIAGDLNNNPDSPQTYNNGYRGYKNPVKNGYDKNGLQIISMGRIWFDYSNPMNFLRNEMEVILDYDIACALTTQEPSRIILKTSVWPERGKTPGKLKRLPFTFVNFTHINTLYNMPKEEEKSTAVITALAGAPGLGSVNGSTGGNVGNLGGSMGNSGSSPIDKNISQSQLSDAPGDSIGSMGDNTEKQEVHFPIRNAGIKVKMVESIGAESYLLGAVPAGTRDKFIKEILDQAEKELNEDEPNPLAGPWNIADRIFALQVKNKDTGIRFPEMTVNALLVDSAELNAKWNFGNNLNKVNNELGNISNKAMRSFPWAKDKSTRMILRHHGSMVHLRNRPVKEFLSGTFRDDQPIIRQLSYDQTYASGGGDYYPPYQMAGFTVINWQDEASSEEEYNKIN